MLRAAQKNGLVKLFCDPAKNDPSVRYPGIKSEKDAHLALRKALGLGT